MKNEMDKRLNIRLNGEILEKFKYVCAYKGRSANRQVIQLMLKMIADYEHEHGKINLEVFRNEKRK